MKEKNNFRVNISLRTRLLLSFVAVIFLIGLLSTILGIRLIKQSLPQIQDVVEVDLSAAREIYRQSVSRIEDAVRLMSQQHFLLEQMQEGGTSGLLPTLQAIRQSEDLDILILTDLQGEVLLRATNPGEKKKGPAIIKAMAEKAVQRRQTVSSTEIFSREELAMENPELAERARIQVISTLPSQPQAENDPGSGLVIVSGAPIVGNSGKILGVLCGGQLLNRRDGIVDRIRNSLYRKEKYDARDVCSVSIYLGEKRISTSVTDSLGERALGTLVSRDVYNQVVVDGKSWVNRSYVNNDWYLAAYEPILNMKGDVIGTLGIGLLERKFEETEQHALRIFLVLTVVALLLATAVSFALLNSILKPLEKLRTAIEEIASGPELNDVRIVHAPPEIEALVKRFNSMQGVIRERRRLNQEKLMHSDRLATIGQLAAGVAHEINNPLGSILLFSRLIMQQVPADSSIRENVERIEKESKRCHSIIQSLLDFARRRKPRVELVDINRLLDETLKLFESQYTFQNVEVLRDFDPSLPTIQADHAQLQQVFMNIIINATDAMAGKGRLTLETGESKEEGRIEIVISDTGCGIPPENIEHIFDPFFTTKGVGHGTGLGLSVSYGIIQGHNGEIIVSSTVGTGSRFTIILPKMKENA